MPGYTPLHKPGHSYTRRASAAVTGGRLVEVTGPDTVAHAAAASAKVIGVAAFDTPAGGDVTVIAAAVHRLVATGAITAGDRVAAAAAGKAATAAAPATGTQVGIALSTAADGDTVEVAWTRA